MNAPARTLFVLLLGSGFAGSALAAMDAAQTTDAQGPHMSQKLHDDLTKAGFTDISIMPQSLLAARPKDAQGNPVMMVINPDFADRSDGAHGGGQSRRKRPSQAQIQGAPNSPIPAPAPKQ